MKQKDKILQSLSKDRQPKDYVKEFISVRALLAFSGETFSKSEYCRTVGISHKTLNSYLDEFEDEVVAEIREEVKAK